jgi:hypothetical protein
MEENPMESMSLLYALLGIDPGKGITQTAQAEPDSLAGKFYAMDSSQKDQVLESLYKVLYLVIEEHKLPSNSAINRAIGKTLAMAMNGEIASLVDDGDLTRTREMLTPVVRGAIEELKP